MKEWKSLFRPHILERGYDCYLDEWELISEDIINKNKGSGSVYAFLREEGKESAKRAAENWKNRGV